MGAPSGFGHPGAAFSTAPEPQPSPVETAMASQARFRGVPATRPSCSSPIGIDQTLNGNHDAIELVRPHIRGQVR